MNPQEMLQRALAKTKAAAAAPTTPPAPPAPQHPELGQLVQVINELRVQLLTENPVLEMYTVIIHKQMSQYPELVHLLCDDDIATVYRAALVQSDTVLVKTKAAAEKKTKTAVLQAGQDW